MSSRLDRQAFCCWQLIVAGLALVLAAGCTRLSGQPQEADGLTTSASQAEATSNLSLDPEQREYLWQIEHHGLLLGKHGFGPLKQALVLNDVKGLEELFAGDFHGFLVGKAHEVSTRTGVLEIARRRQEEGSGTPADARRFVEQLLTYRRPFLHPPQAEIKLMKLAPEQEGYLDSPFWRGTCLLRLWGESGPGEPSEVTLHVAYRIPKPTKENLAALHWLHEAAITESQVSHAQRFLLKDVTRERGIDAQLLHDNWECDLAKRKGNTGNVLLCDFDRDGILDLLITDTDAGCFLYKGLPGGKFKDVTEQMGLPRRPQEGTSLVAAFVDLDGDGWEDLILDGRIYRNEQGRKFVDYTERCNLRLPGHVTGIAVADYDRDGLVDLYVTRAGKDKANSWLEGKSGDAHGNLLFRNLGNWQFRDVTESAGASGDQRSTFTAVWLDANNDGWPDLYVIHEFGDGVLLVNNRDGTFREQMLTQTPSDFGTMGVAVGDIDNDGNIDIYAANMYSKAGARVMGNLKAGSYPDPIMAKMRRFVAGSQLWRNKGNLQFEKLADRCEVGGIGWAYGAALVDLDNDGWLDLYTTCGFMSQSRTDPDG